jgi:Arc/MetJ-type ribon-helix-helix transcriptional regulator
VTVEVTVRVTEDEAAALDGLIAKGRFVDRSAALRAALAALLHEEREREIDEAYRRGYGKFPQEHWIGEAGLASLEAWSREEGGEPL